MQSSSVEQYVDASQEMECQSQETKQQKVVTKSVGRRQHYEIAEAVSSVLKEEKEKSKRKLNTILHNIPESDADTPEVRKEHDTDTVKAIINQHLSIPTSVSNVTWLGKKSDKSCLLRITVATEQDKAIILRNCVKVRSIKEHTYLGKVFITPDLTMKEREENKTLRNRLSEMNKESNKYQIKNGRIVPRRN